MRRMQFLVLAVLAAGCNKSPDATLTLPPEAAQVQVRESDPPIALNAESPVEYPVALYQQRISATVLLRLYADESGTLIPDSTRVQESSGYPALDSAAVAAVPRLRYAPGLRNGVAVATAFTQPIRFRHPDRSGVTP
ncbi:MAG: energy transducer TonB [Gemmatimonadales bacterium]